MAFYHPSTGMAIERDAYAQAYAPFGLSHHHAHTMEPHDLKASFHHHHHPHHHQTPLSVMTPPTPTSTPGSQSGGQMGHHQTPPGMTQTPGSGTPGSHHSSQDLGGGGHGSDRKAREKLDDRVKRPMNAFMV